jgi:hypothetical protein
MTDEPKRHVIDADTLKELFAEDIGSVTYITNERVVVAGVEVEVVPTGSVEDATAIICAQFEPGVTYPNSVLDACSRCGAVVWTRRHAPKKPPRLCLPCALRQGLFNLR